MNCNVICESKKEIWNMFFALIDIQAAKSSELHKGLDLYGSHNSFNGSGVTYMTRIKERKYSSTILFFIQWSLSGELQLGPDNQQITYFKVR